MSIAIIDQGAELFWFTSQALVNDEFSLKHLKSKETAELYILQELPKIVIINDDDGAIESEVFIGKIRNHVFARSTMFIVVTSNPSSEHKRSLIIAGAGQIFYRGKGQNPSQKFFRNIILWFLNIKNPNPELIEYLPVPFHFEGEFTSYGRIGWLSPIECLIEINLDLKIGDVINVRNQLFDELDIKEVQLSIVEKNTTGRYYQYSNSFLCQIKTKKSEQEKKKISAWIASNQDISKHKPIKIVYFEHDSDGRDAIRKMIKLEKRYCARGYGTLDDFLENLNYQLPQLILIDRKLIVNKISQFEILKKYLETHFCYCVTYDNENKTNVEDFKNQYDYIMHLPKNIELDLLESMITKLEVKLNSKLESHSLEKIYFNKYSPFSRLSMHAQAQVTELAISGLGVNLPFALTPNCAFELTLQGFTHLSLNRTQFFRNVQTKQLKDSYCHQCFMLGQNLSENKLIKITVEKIKQDGFDKWKLEN